MSDYGPLIFSGILILLSGFLVALPLTFRGLISFSSWLALLVGLGLYLLITFIQPPFQNWVLGSFSSEVSLALRTLTLAVIAGALQELLKFLFLGGFRLALRDNILWIGAMLGLGFSLGEGFYLLYSIKDLTYSMPSFLFFLDRLSSLLFHIGLGFFLAYGFKHRLLLITLPSVVILHSAFVYLGLMHVDKKISAWGAVGIGLACSLILYLLALLYYFRELSRPRGFKRETVRGS